jgi:hypothetical protein
MYVEFALEQGIIKNRHFFVAHDHKFLFFVRMQPTDKDMPFNPAFERKHAHGHVGNVPV